MIELSNYLVEITFVRLLTLLTSSSCWDSISSSSSPSAFLHMHVHTSHAARRENTTTTPSVMKCSISMMNWWWLYDTLYDPTVNQLSFHEWKLGDSYCSFTLQTGIINGKRTFLPQKLYNVCHTYSFRTLLTETFTITINY